jgi:hypothetical protein
MALLSYGWDSARKPLVSQKSVAVTAEVADWIAKGPELKMAALPWERKAMIRIGFVYRENFRLPLTDRQLLGL